MIRFLADASLDHPILTGCVRREPSMDFLSANAANLEGIPDSQVLPIGLAIDSLVLIWTASSESDWINQVHYLPL